MLQIFLVFLKKQTMDSKIYIITDTVLKISLAIYLLIFSFIHTFLPLGFEDIMILRLCGGVMLFDIDYKGLLNEFLPLFNLYKKIEKLNPIERP
jgi:hypothetical protein